MQIAVASKVPVKKREPYGRTRARTGMERATVTAVLDPMERQGLSNACAVRTTGARSTST
jgi:DNA-binding MarR family transcriptional regulator